MRWVQNYYAVGDNIFLTALCAALPVLFLFWALAIKKIQGHIAIFLAWFLTILVSVFAYRMPLSAVLSAAAFGAVNGFFTLCWLVFNAVFFFNLIVKSGKFDIIKSSIASISNDRRIQAILIGFCFSAFLEGTTSLGAPIAIAAAMLIGLGFPVLPALVVCFAGNTIPVPFGSVGLATSATVNTVFSGVDGALLAVSGSIGGVMCIYAVIVPFFILLIMCGFRAAKEVFPHCLAAGFAYIIPNFLISRYLGPELPSLLSPLFSLTVVIVFSRFRKPKTIWRFEEDVVPLNNTPEIYSAGKIFHAWIPFILVTLLMIIWSLSGFKNFSAVLPLKIAIGPWPGLHGIVFQAAPIVKKPVLYAAIFNYDIFAAPGTALLISSLLVTCIFKMKFTVFAGVFVATFRQLKFALLTMIFVFSIAYLSNYSGISYTLGLVFAATGPFFIVFSPLIGFLGVFLTGSVTSSGALFGNLQRISAEQLGLNPLITITAGMTGAVMGKLVSLQSIAIGAAATGLVGKEGIILNKTAKHAFILLGIGIVIMIVLTYVFPGYFPELVQK